MLGCGPIVPFSFESHQPPLMTLPEHWVDYQTALSSLQLDLCLNEMCVEVNGTPHRKQGLQTTDRVPTSSPQSVGCNPFAKPLSPKRYLHYVSQ